MTVVVVFTMLCVSNAEASNLPRAFVMPWFCLQRCGFNESQIREHVDQLVVLSRGFGIPLSVVAFERYNLGPNSTLVSDAGLFNLNTLLLTNATLAASVNHRIAMISSFPYPAQLITWMRELFANPGPFIEELVTDLVQNNISGVNVDLEPTDPNITNIDAQNYASFIELLRIRLSVHGKVVTVAGATWSPIWNLTEIAASLVGNSTSEPGYFTSMNTYTYHDESFDHQLNKTLQIFTDQKARGNLIVGLETWPSKFTEKELSRHFQLLRDHDICQLAIWDMPIPVAFIPHLVNVSHRCP